MGKTNATTVNDAQLKARRTSLEKKTNEELINIILRKDSTERKNNVKIIELGKANTAYEESIEILQKRVNDCDVNAKVAEDKLLAKQEQCDSLNTEKNECYTEIVRLKNLCNFKTKVIRACFGIIFVLLVLLLLEL